MMICELSLPLKQKNAILFDFFCYVCRQVAHVVINFAAKLKPS